MMLFYLLPEGGHVDVGVYLGCSDALVTQHSLDGTERGSTLEKGSSKGMTQGVGGDGLLDASHCSLLFYHYENHGASEVCTPAVEKHIILFARLNI